MKKSKSKNFARQKGHSYERYIAIRLRESGLDPNARRNVQETQQASVDILTDLPFAIQCKNLGRWSTTPHAVWLQAAEGKLKCTDIPMGIIKITKRSPDLCFLALDDMINLLLLAYGKKETNRDCKL
jgi:hypothetical protein